LLPAQQAEVDGEDPMSAFSSAYLLLAQFASSAKIKSAKQ
jgi:hypothetical protein